MLRKSRSKTPLTSWMALATCMGVLTLCACGTGASSGSSTGAHLLGGSVSGLGNHTGLVLSNGSDSVAVGAGATNFTMPTPVDIGINFSVTVKNQPDGETCSVSLGVGVMTNADIVNINVTCVVNQYTVGGSLTGLTSAGLVLLNNGTDPTPISANTTQFSMATAVAAGSGYAISVQTQPAGQTCTVSNGAGTVGSSNVSTVAVSCTNASGFATSILYSFGGPAGDGVAPWAGLVQGSDGNLYGTTNSGGAHSAGTVFSITPSGTESVFYSFADGTDGLSPRAAVVQASDGNLYGTTFTSGAHNAGIVYKVTPVGMEKVLYTFAGGGDGGAPTANLIQATDGNLYGTAPNGGLHGAGALYRITLGGTQSVVYSFAGGSDAAFPGTGVIQGNDGNFYGSTAGGGAHGMGAVYSVTPSGTETVLYSFAGGADGGTPLGSLIQASDGNFYGTTQNGGAHGYGAVFKITPSGTETVLYSFVSGADGASPAAGLIQGSDGNFYGTTFGGSPYNVGTIFQVTPSGAETVIYAFKGGTDGAHSVAALIQSMDGNFYGTTRDGGAHGGGTVFRVVGSLPK